jgi:hypothetical protein
VVKRRGSVGYKVERRVYEAMPDVRDQDVMTLSAAARLLGVPFSSLYSYLAAGTLTTIIREDGRRVAYGKPQRYVLRTEVQALLAERQAAGSAVELTG